MDDIDIAIPDFLRATKRRPAPRTLRWKRCPKAARPEGDRWLKARRVELYVDADLPVIACGLRRLWIVEGRKWCRVSDGESKVKVSMRVWATVARRAKDL
jgi:hypothetical protein